MNRNVRVVVSLLLIQAVSVVTLWSTNSVSRAGQDIFTLFLAVDLVAFALMAQVYRSAKNHAVFSRAWMVVGGLFMAAILLVTLII